MKKKLLVTLTLILIASFGFSQSKFNGLEMILGNLYRTSDAKTRSISPENFTGEKGTGGMANLSFDNQCFQNVPHHVGIFFQSACRIAKPFSPKWKINPHGVAPFDN